MNFFAQQDHARRQTRYLLILFSLAVTALIVLTVLSIGFGLWLLEGDFIQQQPAYGNAAKTLSNYIHWQLFWSIALWVSATIGCIIFFKWLSLRSGGKAVAESLGGTRISINTDDADEKKILNVVEEMALASGMPVPAVYLLQGEKGINAFAAGYTPANAVIGVSQGALDQLNREQLQGVIAHEFSHILNGDMRLNLRLIALLSGIVFIARSGELVMRAGGGGYGRGIGYGSGSSKGDIRIFIAGFALWLLGWLGSFFAGLIKAAINRQREYLADAAAVQFTRNPQGIGDALKIIGGYEAGSQIFNAGSSESSHLFICNALGRRTDFSTHPPLATRIRRIDPQWDGQMISRKLKITGPQYQPRSSAENKQQMSEAQQAAVSAAACAAFVARKKSANAAAEYSMSANVDAVRKELSGIPSLLLQQSKDTFGACALVYALLLSHDEAVREKQLEYVKKTAIAGLSIQVREFYTVLAELHDSFRLPLIELAVPALKTLSKQQYSVYKKTLLLLIRADGRLDIFEWCLFQLIRHYLDSEFGEEKPSYAIYKKPSQVSAAYMMVLSLLVHHGYSVEQAQEKKLAFVRGAQAAGLNAMTLLPIESIQLEDFSRAVDQLRNCYPLLKPRLLKGLIDGASHDAVLTTVEKEMIVAIAAAIDCPCPDLLAQC
jgi:Zn-dependent protease with chaperone function